MSTLCGAEATSASVQVDVNMACEQLGAETVGFSSMECSLKPKQSTAHDMTGMKSRRKLLKITTIMYVFTTKIVMQNMQHEKKDRKTVMKYTEHCNSPYFAFISWNSTDFQADYITVVEDRPIVSAKYCLPVPVFYFWRKL